MVENSFVIRQCGNQHCRFRFPAPSEQIHPRFCPKCGFKLDNLGLAYTNYRISDTGSRKNKSELSVLLDNIRSALNVGSILRTCEGFGVKHIYLCGITPTPDNPKVGKTALSADETISWSYHLNGLDVINQLKGNGNQVWSLEVTPKSTLLDATIRSHGNTSIVLVAGNEQAGVDPDILEISDHIVYLPMIGKKRSLNVAVAVGAAVTMLLSSSCV